MKIIIFRTVIQICNNKLLDVLWHFQASSMGTIVKWSRVHSTHTPAIMPRIMQWTVTGPCRMGQSLWGHSKREQFVLFLGIVPWRNHMAPTLEENKLSFKSTHLVLSSQSTCCLHYLSGSHNVKNLLHRGPRHKHRSFKWTFTTQVTTMEDARNQ